MAVRGSVQAAVAAILLLSLVAIAESSSCSIVQTGFSCKKPIPCFRYPCDRLASCPARPDAVCVANSCEGQSYDGKPVGKCTALFIDPVTCKAVDCEKPAPPKCSILNGIKCRKDDPGARCFANPCGKATCLGHPGAKCVPNYCTKKRYYQGKALPGSCSAVWINPRTCKRVYCKKPPAAKCPALNVDGTLVCGKGNPTVQCTIAPCNVAKCARGGCVNSYCTKPVLFNGAEIGGPCKAVCVDGSCVA